MSCLRTVILLEGPVQVCYQERETQDGGFPGGRKDGCAWQKRYGRGTLFRTSAGKNGSEDAPDISHDPGTGVA